MLQRQKYYPNWLSRKKAFHLPLRLMGCGFVITAVDQNAQKAWDGIRAGVQEIRRIEALISSWQKTSETTAINDAAGKQAVKVNKELFDLIQRSIRISKLSSGAFDISGTLARDYWKCSKHDMVMLTEEAIVELRELINYRNIVLDENECSVFLSREGMKIGFGGIGKGYAAQKAYEVMKAGGIESGLINASGDIMCWGQPPQGGLWNVAIPKHPKSEEALVELQIPNGSVTSSGFYENFVLIDGKKYSHIVDPRTGKPSESTNSVSVLCPNPEFADAMATALSVLGASEGIRVINQIVGVEAIIVDQHNSLHCSKNVNL